MRINIRTLGDIRKYMLKELSSLYHPLEIDSITHIIIKTIFNKNRLHHITVPELIISPDDAEKVAGIILQLKKGKPIHYILGETVFYSCKIKVNNSVLIPRQETEELVDLIIKENKGFTGRIIDIGSGSGCISIALAKNLPGAKVIALDNSGEAIETARANASLNQVNIEFLHIDIFNVELFENPSFNIVVSNPPYVRESEKKFLHRNVLDYEPPAALFVSDEDPLIYYRKIIELSESMMAPGGKLYFEINEVMADPLTDIIQSHKYREVKVIKDLNGKNRILKGVYHG